MVSSRDQNFALSSDGFYEALQLIHMLSLATPADVA
jgi:hypothetical protein